MVVYVSTLIQQPSIEKGNLVIVSLKYLRYLFMVRIYILQRQPKFLLLFLIRINECIIVQKISELNRKKLVSYKLALQHLFQLPNLLSFQSSMARRMNVVFTSKQHSNLSKITNSQHSVNQGSHEETHFKINIIQTRSLECRLMRQEHIS